MKTLEELYKHNPTGNDSAISSNSMLNLLPETEEELRLLQIFKQKLVAEIMERMHYDIDCLEHI